MAEIIQFPLPRYDPIAELKEVTAFLDAFVKIKDPIARTMLVQVIMEQLANPVVGSYPGIGGDMHGEWAPPEKRRPPGV